MNCTGVVQVGELYQQYQKAARLRSYLAELEQLLGDSARLRSGAEGLGKEFGVVQGAVQGSLAVKLKHD